MNVPRVLYLNRCPDGCTVAAGADDARVDTSTLGAGTLTALPRLDLAWADIVICARETLGPYGIEVVTEEPAPTADYVEVMIAGLPDELGVTTAALGEAPRACEPQNHGLAFVFGNLVDLAAEPERAHDLCWSAMHQAGHLWGLEDVGDCHDVMREGAGCDLRPWFTRMELPCLECACGAPLQDAHALLTARFGAGAAAPPPGVTVLDAGDGRVRARVDSPRPLDRVELWMGGEVVDTETGAEVTLAGAPGDAEVLAFDDLGRMGGARTTITEDTGCSVGGDAGLCIAVAALLVLRRRHVPARGPRPS